MVRNVFFRDFTLIKAGLLTVLIGIAAFAGEVPGATNGFAAEEGVGKARILPAVIHILGVDCENEDKGVQL
ncbi:hypothetical protein J7443_05700 [Tropicibacter sp. R15_0]|uniref:hypothetical protein n=1 Tax=Tropicibacter sp. R15_0 TaxID=2821101 RepID=UPI001ADA89FF|nr:hypothetical protein [Tropicibacter sp. R15_0]MBO9464714.1 hypothetical protein [Tropicibacter sp. R15_0]